ncbi:uncharacterized protein At1g04910-like [Asparagus officinalis]|uniref:uncharacterized protein At1g04910-like n=1 Tax=Asparagus officinalis TaxID=4686 RepID=UPI00098E107E|nr:uncharacterized protein At1g04910-like [Asparagus officinalis]
MPLDDNGKLTASTRRRASAGGRRPRGCGGGGAIWERCVVATRALRILCERFSCWSMIGASLAPLTAFLANDVARIVGRALTRRASTCPHLAAAAVNSTNNVVQEVNPLGGNLPSPRAKLPRRVYRSNGYLLLSCNGGLNQMRAAICDMVTIARYLNLTLVVPELDKKAFWADASNFEDIFNVDRFIDSLRDEVKIIKKLPQKVISRIHNNDITVYSMAPVSWSNMTYYYKQILPLARKHKVIHFQKTDARLANNGLPLSLQKLRCRVNYDALMFTPHIEALGKKLISVLQRNKYFVVLHLRYEMDMLAFSGCSHGCSDEQAEELTKKRYLVEWWKEKEIDSEQKRLEGRCPLTPEETTLVLRALEFDKDTTIYIAAGTIYGGEKRMAALRDLYPNIVDKEMLLSPDDLEPLRNHSNQMAALDYFVAIASDVFIPTFDGHMAKVVEGHRRYNGFRKSIVLDRKILVEHLDLYQNGEISWDQFSHAVREAQKNHWGQPAVRKVMPGLPKEEDYFYSNPQECLSQ